MAGVPRSRRRRLAELALLLFIVVLPLVSTDLFFVDRFGRYFLWGVFALSVDLVWGQGGMLTFGHAAFFGGGGYLAAMLTTHDSWILPLPLGAAIAVAVAGSVLFAFVMSSMAFMGRAPLRGVEFAVITLAIAFLLEQSARAGGTVSGGQNGILIRSRLEIPGVISLHRGYGFYTFAASVLVAMYVLSRFFVSSRPGLILRGIRENEDRVDRLGYRVTNIKRMAFALSAAMASLAGSLFYVHDGIVSPSAVGVGSSTLVLLWVVLGGRGTLVGPIVGALVLSHLTATLSGTYLDSWLLIVGAVMVAAIMIFPAGFLGWLSRGSDR